MKLPMPYVRGEVERMLSLAPSTALGLISYSKLLGDRYMSRSIFHLIRKIVMTDVMDGLMPNMCWESQSVNTLGSRAEMYVYHHINTSSPYLKGTEGSADYKRLWDTLVSLKRRCVEGSDSYNALDQTLHDLWVIRRDY